jgi:hypothetical protein
MPVKVIGGTGAGGSVVAYAPQFSDAALQARGLPAQSLVAAPISASPGNTALAIGQLFIAPFPVRRTGTINFLGIRLGVNGGAGSRLRIGIYASDATQLPTTLLFDSGDLVADAGAPIVLSVNPNLKVTAGTLLWLAYEASIGGPAPTVSSANFVIGQNTAGTGFAGFSATFAYAALPAAFPNAAWTVTTPADILVGYA